MPKDISEIRSFGQPSAERDDLQRYFVSTPVFQELIEGQKHIVIGRKGGGKTALYQALLRKASEEGGVTALGLTFKTYPWKIHAQYADDSGDDWERFQAPWRFLIYISIAAELVRQLRDGNLSRKLSSQGDALGHLKKFIEKHYGTMDFNYKKAFPKGGFSFEGIKIEPSVRGGTQAGHVKASLGGASFSRNSRQLGDTIVRLNEWLWNSLKEIGPSAEKTFVLFDELDAGFDPGKPDYVDRVIGLLIAVRQVAFEFEQAGAPWHPIAFLRTDIYDRLQFGDKGKITQEDAVFLHWNDALRHTGSSLKELIDWRIQKSLELEDSIDKAWGRAFEPSLMRGTQHKFTHMAARSYLRPRDIIQFSNFALKEARSRLDASPNGARRITNDDMRHARTRYSSWFLGELDDEIAEAYPDWKNYLEILKRIHYTRFTRSALTAAYRRTAESYSLSMKLEEVLYFFYEFSIVGFERFAGSSGTSFHFRYQNEQIQLNPTARAFLVHWGLKEALDLKDTGDPVSTVAW